ncbi:Lipoxygenase [Rhizoclosmatium globosum]|uniref:Manganese lipoxygenase n=1 Tax=Rhizoclosmatium globosum TaxID=329046 RepID=A0A1Y2CWN7_9FUNG|nr:Lipoxygenase [Rhizoclosmatium globosum]|eukprot:ORY51451.1 Lipoxygenase [Rhizoclosmatium globosum]
MPPNKFLNAALCGRSHSPSRNNQAGTSAGGATRSNVSVSQNVGAISGTVQEDRPLTLPFQDSDIKTRSATLKLIQKEFRHESRFGISKGPAGLFGDTFVLEDQTAFVNATFPFTSGIAKRSVAARVHFDLEEFKPTKFSDYDEMYKFLDKPNWHGLDWQSDEYFGRARMTCAHWYLTPVNKLPFSLHDNQVEGLLDGDETLAQALEKDKVYVIDHSGYTGLNVINKPGYHMTYPTAVFYYSEKEGQLMPIAIQTSSFLHLGMVVTPKSGEGDWLLAKMIVNSMDFWRSNDVDHFIDVHIAIEPINTAKFRTLSKDHPVYVIVDALMRQNTGLIASGQLLLLSDGGDFSLFAASGIAEKLSLAARQAGWSYFNDIPTTDKRLTKFPAFKYLNAHYQAIIDLMTDLINAFYDSDDAIVQDTELQAFAHDVSSSEFGAVAGFPTEFSSRADLVKTLALLQYKVSVRHHAINSFTLQWSTGTPYAPWAFYKPIPVLPGYVTMDNIMEWMPPMDDAVRAWTTSNKFFTPLTVENQAYWIYNNTRIVSNAGAVKALSKFRRKMDELSKAIQTDPECGGNKTLPWKTLDPHLMPNYVYI